jgi:hypothetical protein
MTADFPTSNSQGPWYLRFSLDLGFGIWDLGFPYAYIPRILVTVLTRWMATM